MKCKNCNEKDGVKYSKYSSGEFCSRECAKSYSTKSKRKEINKKVSEKLKGKMVGGKKGRKERVRVCISCGEKSFGRAKYCSLCKQYINNIVLFEKLEVLNKNLQQANAEALKILSREYFTKRYGLIQIEGKYKILRSTLHFFFKKNGVNLRTISKANKLAVKEGRMKSPINPTYETGYHTAWYGKEFFYRSSYERRMMEILDNRKELYFYETIRVEYEFEGETSTHITDFYLPERNLVIEVKGEWFQKRDKEKIEAKKNAVLSEGYYFIMLGNKEIEQYENGKDL